MKRLAFLLGVLVIGGLLVSSAYAGGKVVGVDQRGMAAKATPAKVEVAKVSLVDAVKAYFSTRLGFSIIKDRSKEPTKPSEPQKESGWHNIREYVSTKDSGWDVGSK